MKMSLQGEAEHIYDTTHALVLPSDGTAPVRRLVPVAGGGEAQACPSLLEDDAGHDVLVRLLELGEGGYTGLQDTIDPSTQPVWGELVSS